MPSASTPFGWRAASGRRAASRLDNDDDDDDMGQPTTATAETVGPACPGAVIPPGFSPPERVIDPGIKEPSPRGTNAIVLAIAQYLSYRLRVRPSSGVTSIGGGRHSRPDGDGNRDGIQGSGSDLSP